eukprot:7641098-Pyramimonas_sp.AAC.1
MHRREARRGTHERDVSSETRSSATRQPVWANPFQTLQRVASLHSKKKVGSLANLLSSAQRYHRGCVCVLRVGEIAGLVSHIAAPHRNRPQTTA